MRALLNRLGDTADAIDEVSVHTPNLDDVFFALTSQLDEPTPTAIAQAELAR